MVSGNTVGHEMVNNDGRGILTSRRVSGKSTLLCDRRRRALTRAGGWEERPRHTDQQEQRPRGGGRLGVDEEGEMMSRPNLL